MMSPNEHILFLVRRKSHEIGGDNGSELHKTGKRFTLYDRMKCILPYSAKRFVVYLHP